MKAPSLKEELAKYLEIKFPGLDPKDYEDFVASDSLRTATESFYAGAFMALSVWNDLACSVPMPQAEKMLTAFIHETEAACCDEVKRALRARN